MDGEDMGAVKDRSKMGLAEAKQYARAQQVECELEDFVLSLALDAAKERADYICRNNFSLTDYDGFPVLDEDGNEIPGPIPMEVEMWVLRKFVKTIKHRTAGVAKESMADIGSTTLDQELEWKELSSFIRYS